MGFGFGIEDWGLGGGLELGIGIGYWDWGLGGWIGIGDCGWGLGWDWGLGLGIGNWDWGLGIQIGDWYWGLVLTFVVINDVDTTKIIGRLAFIIRFRYDYNSETNGHATSLLTQKIK